MNFNEFFNNATGHGQPFDYQRRLAGGNEGCRCESKLINIPTGLGKTAAVVLAWLWNRVALNKAGWPRRLVYCLPMRTLVEQTAKNTVEWLQSLNLSETVDVHSLMGGEDAGEWDIHPEKPAVLIGTQDMRLFLALNRGYGMSRYRWSMHFGLLNNDCLFPQRDIQTMVQPAFDDPITSLARVSLLHVNGIMLLRTVIRPGYEHAPSINRRMSGSVVVGSGCRIQRDHRVLRSHLLAAHPTALADRSARQVAWPLQT